MSYVEELNPAQRKAVLHTDGPILIVAGAGAGKTKTLTYRILHLVREGVAPSAILAITFTNKAAKEMYERVHTLLERDAVLNMPITFRERPFISTFHALGVHILRENAVKLAIPRHFSIFDRSDATRAMKDALKSAGFDPKQFDPAKCVGVMSRKKGDNFTLQRWREEGGGSSNYFDTVLMDAWERYEAILAREKALDFDDLLLKTAELLRTDDAVRLHYQNIWQYIHVDEYQDTNKVQYMLTRHLAAGHHNIAVVGDSDQTIYTWRGADIKNILAFEEDYKEAHVVLLEENYRSTQTILAVANSIIAKNTLRKEKTLFTKNDEGEKLSLDAAADEQEEARTVVIRAQALIESGVPSREIAVLYRANFQSRALEQAFLDARMPYQVVGTRFFERKEIKDMLAFIHAALNPDSHTSIRRVINVPPRGIGRVTLLKIFAGRERELTGAMKERVKIFRSLLASIRDAIATKKTSDVLRFVIQATGIEKVLGDSILEEDHERLLNIRELASLALKYDALPCGEGIEELLSDAALASDQDALMENKDAVKLMTVHASKGLEFDHVFITGLESGLFPNERADESSLEREEEERRLFYVALTRARKKVHLSCASTRTIFGSREYSIPSEFLTDIDEEFLEVGGSFLGGERVISLDDYE